MQTHLLLRGIVMGFALGIPVGPICLLCIHRALANGWLTAFLSTLGAVVADCILGAAVGLGSSVIAPWVEHEQTPLRVVGGVFMVAVGVRSLYTTLSMEPEARSSSLAREFASSFLITMFNPANLLGVLGVFAAVGTFRSGELESLESVDRFLGQKHPRLTKRLRQVVGVLVRMIMEGRGWRKTGRKGSLGVRAKIAGRTSEPGSYHNTGGLAFWFLRAERYERPEGMPFRSVRQRRRAHDKDSHVGPKSKRGAKGGAEAGPSNGKPSSRDDAGSLRKKGIR